ncbi:MAG: class I SAM-dependent methyltransferase [Chloroflexota bacterium]
MDVVAYNRSAWDRQVAHGNRWTVPVGPEVIAAARLGVVELLLTPTKIVPREWYPPLPGADVLCLASGGGQQGPVLAAAGARVTVFDNSPAQLAQDRLVAEREGLEVRTVLGDMADLSAFPAASFDLIFHPVSNCFAPAVRPVWREAYRVLRRGGVLLAAFNNPTLYLFDQTALARGELIVRHKLPYADVDVLSPDELAHLQERGWPLEFSHSLEDQIGGQLDAGFMLTALFEDHWLAADCELLSQYMPVFIATRAVKP